MNVDAITAKAYRASNLLAVCARALDSDAPMNPGDPYAISQAVKSAEDQINALIDALEAPDKPATAPEGIAGLYAAWQASMARIKDAVVVAGGDEPDTPAFRAMQDEWEALAQRIANTAPTTYADATALAQWLHEDTADGVICPLLPVALKNLSAFLSSQPKDKANA